MWEKFRVSGGVSVLSSICIPSNLTSAPSQRSSALPAGRRNYFYRHADLEDADYESAIPNRSDRRAMGPQFRLGVVAASRVLSASKADVRETSIYVATRVAERDEGLDYELFSLPTIEQADLNAAIMDKLRPTVFLSQLPNLLAGNLAITLGLRGTSRTFLGEELGGATALATAIRDIESGRRRQILAGGSLNADRENLLRWIYSGGHGANTAEALEQNHGRGIMLATTAAFSVLADSEHVEAIAYIRNLGIFSATGPDLYANALAAVRERHPGEPVHVITNSQGHPGTRRDIQAWKAALLPADCLMMSADVRGSSLEVDCFAQLSMACEALATGHGDPSLPQTRVLIHTQGLEGGNAFFLVSRSF